MHPEQLAVAGDVIETSPEPLGHDAVEDGVEDGVEVVKGRLAFISRFANLKINIYGNLILAMKKLN